MIPEENPAEVEANIRERDRRRQLPQPARHHGGASSAFCWRDALQATAGQQAAWWTRMQQHGKRRVWRSHPARWARRSTPTCALFCEAGIPGVIYGAGPRTVLESHAKRADERLDLDDLRRATKVIARSLLDLLRPAQHR